MTRIRLLVLTTLAALAVGPPARAAFVTLNVPGATATYAYGIDGGKVVGTYEAGGHSHGFIYDGSTYTTLDVPGASYTELRGIRGSAVVGFYGSGGRNPSFLYTGGTFSPIAVPGSVVTLAFGVSADRVVGAFDDITDMNDSGFIYDRLTGSYTEVDVAGASQTSLYGVDGTAVVGNYQNGIGQGHGFIYDGVNLTTLDVPGARATAAYGISGRTVVGQYVPLAGFPYRGFLYDRPTATFTLYDVPVPGAGGTQVFGVSGNTIVGVYTDALGRSHGFIDTLAPAAVPEPASVALLGVAAVGVLGAARRRIGRR